MYLRVQKARTIGLFSLLFFLFFLHLHNPPSLGASSQAQITASVQVSVCGNNTAENSEDCDGGDIGGKICDDLGYKGGNLACSISCNYATASCVPAEIDHQKVKPEETGKLVAAGLLTPPTGESMLSTPSLTSTDSITVSVPDSNGNFDISLEDDTTVTASDGSNFDSTGFTASTEDKSLVSGLDQGQEPVADALQWGIVDETLEFDPAITIELPVGSSYDGKTLSVYRSASLTSGWTADGLVDSSCVVVGGTCTFKTTKASYFIGVSNSSGSTSSTTSTSTSTSSNTTSTSTTTTTSTTAPKPTVTISPVKPKVTVIVDQPTPNAVISPTSNPAVAGGFDTNPLSFLSTKPNLYLVMISFLCFMISCMVVLTKKQSKPLLLTMIIVGLGTLILAILL